MDVIQPLWMLKYLPNFLACQVSIMHDAQGPNNSITENEVAPLLALGEAWRILQRDDADFFLVGGSDHKTNPLSMARQSLFEKLSHRNDAPEKACRPFDRGRDGIVLGEGGACLVFEELEHAKKRGARIYGEVVGFAAGFDRRRDGKGLARVIRSALNEAGIAPTDVDHVNAQGYSGVEYDRWEARAIREAFGEACPPVFAAKSYFGNLAISLLALQHGILPPTLNYEEPDPECPIPVLAGSPHTVRKPHVLKISFTGMGQCAALVVRKA
jgi:3-oxoacyl-[acyl-carrier-protein] synthase II